MGLENSNISGSLVQPNIQSPHVNLVFRETDFTRLLTERGRIMPLKGSYPLKWNLNTVGITAVLFDSSTPIPATQNQTSQQASLSPFGVMAAIGVSGEVRDQVNNGGTSEDAVKLELDKGKQDCALLIESTLLGSAQDKGIASIVDDSDTYAGLAPGSVTQWKSQENTSTGTLTLSAFQTLYRQLFSSPRAASPDVILADITQVMNYVNLQGPSATTGLVAKRELTAGGGPWDMGVFTIEQMPSFSGIPFRAIRGLTVSEIYMLDMGKNPDDFCLIQVRDFTVEPTAKLNDGNQWVMTWRGMLKVKNRRRQGKMTGVS